MNYFSLLLIIGLFGIIRATTYCDASSFDPNDPTNIPCCLFPDRFIQCNPINCTTYATEFQYDGEMTIPYAQATCSLNTVIQCSGSKTWLIDDFPCVKYNGKHLTFTIILSLWGGLFGLDRCYLDQCLLGVFKGLSLGGLGIWWLIDLITLLNGGMCPEGNCMWEPIY
eukprot:TRINITY_DN3171_c3_g12_i1.p1 TRINITY_DN3171_c3_g12~~TRINITY_DN3171_c3_g12_i1.p1  ORF type:complete len:187 (-),score=36.12 TRINITY_DN3171_c3_g12_i1:39-542(-)